MDGIISIQTGNIYSNKLNIIGTNHTPDVCVVIKNIEADDAAIPVYKSITYRLAMMDDDNINYDAQYFILGLHGVMLTPVMLNAMGFDEIDDVLYGLDCARHYVGYMQGSRLDNAIRLVEVETGVYKLASMTEENNFSYSLSKKKIRYIHELQDIIREAYQINLKLNVNHINHFMLFEQEIEHHLSVVVDCMNNTGIRQLDEIQKCISTPLRPYSEKELKILMNYGYRKNVFKYPYIADNMTVELCK